MPNGADAISNAAVGRAGGVHIGSLALQQPTKGNFTPDAALTAVVQELASTRRDVIAARGAAEAAVNALGVAARLFNRREDSDADEQAFAENLANQVACALEAVTSCKRQDGGNVFDGSNVINCSVDERLVERADVALMSVSSAEAVRTFHIRAGGEAVTASATLRRGRPPVAKAAAEIVGTLRVTPAMSIPGSNGEPIDLPLHDAFIDRDLCEDLNARLVPTGIRADLKGDAIVLRGRRAGTSAGFGIALRPARSVAAADDEPWQLEEVVAGTDMSLRVDGRPGTVNGCEAEFRHGDVHLLLRLRADAKRSAANSCAETTAVARNGWCLPVCRGNGGTWVPFGWRRRAGGIGGGANGPRLVVSIPDLGPETLGLAALPLGALTPQDVISGGASGLRAWGESITVGLRQSFRVHARLGECLAALDEAATVALEQLRPPAGTGAAGALDALAGNDAACRDSDPTRRSAA